LPPLFRHSIHPETEAEETFEDAKKRFLDERE
jgi:hypothetical protein